MCEKVELESLVGKHFLSGVDFGIHKWNSGFSEESCTMLFILDDVTYEAIEDPDDGYRSCLESLMVSDKEVRTKFPKQEVVCKMKEDDKNYSNDILQFIDVITGKVVLEVGTDHYDDYYPCCVMNWYPENLAINNRVSTDEN